MRVYTLGIWTVKGGREGHFVSAWQELADRTKSDFPEETATLLRDRDQPNRFISFGPWDSLQQIEQWRTSDTFEQGVGKLRAMLDDFVAHTTEVFGPATGGPAEINPAGQMHSMKSSRTKRHWREP